MWKRPKFLLPLAVIALLAGLVLFPRPLLDEEPRKELALMTSLPIYWGEGADFGTLVSGNDELPWVRVVLEKKYELQPLDTLTFEGDIDLGRFDRMIIAQPRAISPQDNVALDDWVNGGGRLLMVIDPLLTGDYSVPLGDPAHPMTIGLLPPVLERWGIGMTYDENQTFALQSIEAEGINIPFAMAGRVHLFDHGTGSCDLSHEGIVAQCVVGQGRVTLLADATLFELNEESSASRKSLSNLVDFAFD